MGQTQREYNPKNMLQPIRMQGQQLDAETGLFYNRHRYYDPAGGRYVTQDPIGLAGGVNLYGYVNSPTGSIDPLGLWSTRAHNMILDAYGKRQGLSSEAIRAMKDGSVSADAMKYQGPDKSHMHSMSSKEQDKKTSCQKANEFIDGIVNQDPNDYLGGWLKGFGLHSVMDSTSPAHMDFTLWRTRDFHKHGPFPSSLENNPTEAQISETVDKMIEFEKGARFDCACFN